MVSPPVWSLGDAVLVVGVVTVELIVSPLPDAVVVVELTVLPDTVVVDVDVAFPVLDVVVAVIVVVPASSLRVFTLTVGTLFAAEVFVAANDEPVFTAPEIVLAIEAICVASVLPVAAVTWATSVVATVLSAATVLALFTATAASVESPTFACTMPAAVPLAMALAALVFGDAAMAPAATAATALDKLSLPEVVDDDDVTAAAAA